MSQISLNDTPERRELVRVPCSISISAKRRSPSLGEIRDISLDGLFLACADWDLKPGTVLPLTFRLGGDGPQIQPVAEVIRIEPDGAGMRFIRMSSREARKLRRFVAETASTVAHRECAARLHDVAGRTAEAIESAERIDALLRQSQDAAVPLTLIASERSLREQGRIVAASSAGDRFEVDGSTQLQAGESVFVLYTLEYVSYSYVSPLLEAKGNAIVLQRPTRLFYSERRSGPRTTDTASGKLRVPAPWANGVLEWPLVEMSASGLSVAAEPGESSLLPGTPLPGAEIIVDGGEPTRLESAIVRHVTPFKNGNGSGALRIGISHGAAPKLKNAETKQLARTPTDRSGPVHRMLAASRKLVDAATYIYHKRIRRARSSEQSPFEVVTLKSRAGLQIVGLLNRSFVCKERLRGPVIVIIPGFGARKETLNALALTMLHNFRREHREAAILRIDGTNNLGESQKADGCDRDGMHNWRYTVSGCADDVLSALDWARSNPYIDATEIVVVSTSFSSIGVRHALAQSESRDVGLWISYMGAADAQDSILHVGGNVDAIGAHMRGLSVGPVSLIGCLVDGDHFCRDAFDHDVATLDDARREMAAICCPILWVMGTHDAFSNPDRVRDVMGVGPTEARHLIEIDAGHLPRSSDEALAQFALITGRLWRHLYGRELAAATPSKGWIGATASLEWERVRREPVSSPDAYWHDYLLGDDGIGFDILEHSADYQMLVADQAELAKAHGKRVVDIGAGTGNLARALLDAGADEVHCLDVVPAALEKIQVKLASDKVFTRTCDVDGGIVPFIRRWCRGQLPGPESLVGRIPGLSPRIAEPLISNYDPTLHAFLRGGALSSDSVMAGKGFSRALQDLCTDINTVARLSLGLLDEAQAAQRLTTIGPELLTHRAGLPYDDASVDAVVASLLLSYLNYPLDTLHEARRVLRPGGCLVVSSMKPDADSSKLFVDLIEKLETAAEVDLPADRDRETLLQAAREFMSKAATLMRLEEEGMFQFYSADELRELVLVAGFEEPTIRASFGSPPQAVIVGCRRP